MSLSSGCGEGRPRNTAVRGLSGTSPATTWNCMSAKCTTSPSATGLSSMRLRLTKVPFVLPRSRRRRLPSAT